MFTHPRRAGDRAYSAKEGLRVLIGKEFLEFLENEKGPLAVDKTVRDPDQCRDGRQSSFLLANSWAHVACSDDL